MIALTRDEVVSWLGDIAVPALRILVVVIMAEVAVIVLRRTTRAAFQKLVERGDSPLVGSRLVLEKLGLADGEAPPRELTANRNLKRVDALSDITNNLIKVVVWLIAVFMILGTLGINLGPLVAGAGIAGIALGFGAQSIVKDFLSGILMLVEDQFGIGDVIDVGEASGVVESLSLRTTRLRSIDGTVWHVPNGEIRRVGNMSQGWSRSVIDVGIGYGSDIDTSLAIMKGVAEGMSNEETWNTKLLEKPELLGVQELGDSSVVLRMWVVTEPAAQWDVSRELRRRIKYAFDAAGIEIPFPQMTAHLRRD
ncbi:MAG: mechanosensitive ion channel family protein [Ilumatobacteraceae bacterium]|jgi:small-conductance mechanosensitive channel|nr:mechanosensitive ion channel family protein [Actinomycetota bacterium]MDA3012702.1 mechanosensitive ion channel family protein [Actinomycetota bacterium]MDA3025596.1 mechanosensitive ion channel family protein [Actinomycetota bacterium]